MTAIPWHLDASVIPASRQFATERLSANEFASLRGWTRDPSVTLRQAPPRPPMSSPCTRHGEDTVEVTTWGQLPTFMCERCGGDRDVPAGALHVMALERYAAERAEYDRLTERVDEIERSLAVQA